MQDRTDKAWRALAVVVWAASAIGPVQARVPTEGTWRLYATLPDGGEYRWRSDLFAEERHGVFRVWAQGDYARPKPIPVKTGETPDELAHGVLVKQRIVCASHQLQTLYAGYFDQDEYFIRQMEDPLPMETPKAGTVGAALVQSVCSLLVKGYRPATR